MAKQLARDGHEVIQISRLIESFKSSEQIEGVQHLRVKSRNAPANRVLYKLFDLLYTLRAVRLVPSDCDIVVTNTFWAPFMLRRNLRGRNLIDVARMPKGQLKLYPVSCWFRANSTAVTKRIHEELGGNGRHRIFTIANPLPYARPGDLKSIRKENVILYVGRLHPEKGLELLIRAFGLLDEGWELRIIGPHAYENGGGGKSYYERLQKLSAGHKVVFLGPIYDPEELNRHYAVASIFVYPSLAEQGETFGLAPLEAMAMACVPVVSNLDCFQDFIVHQHNGLVFDHRSEQAIDLLLKELRFLTLDASSRAKLSKVAVDVRKTHSIEAITAEFVRVFHQIASKSKPNRTTTHEGPFTNKSLP